MTTLEEIDKMQRYLEITCSCTGEEIQERISIISVYLARTGEMLADAKRSLRRKKSSEISEAIIKIAKESCLSAKVQNTLLESIAEDEAYLVDRLDRMNAACTHQLDSLRSLLSYEKEQLRLTNTGY
jgi:hypothetical protein